MRVAASLIFLYFFRATKPRHFYAALHVDSLPRPGPGAGPGAGASLYGRAQKSGQLAVGAQSACLIAQMKNFRHQNSTIIVTALVRYN